MKFHKKLIALAQQELPTMVDNLIIKDGNTYKVFGKYTITKQKYNYQVITTTDIEEQFSSTRSALAWCIADKFNNLNLARDIVNLDSMITRQQQDIQVRKAQITRCKDGNFADTVAAKVDCKQQQCRVLEHELSKCINRAKYLQYRGFSNETSRTGRAPSNRTNR